MQLGGTSVSAEQHFDELTGGRFPDLSVDALGLPLFTIAVGVIDGFNPCAMWVLTFLLSLLVGIGSRRKMILITGTFVLVSGLMYFAFMAACSMPSCWSAIPGLSNWCWADWRY